MPDKESGNKGSDGRQRGVEPLDLGDREPPEPLETVMQRAWIAAEGDEPEELTYARTHRTVYIPPGVRGGKSKIDIDDVEGIEEGGYQKASFLVPTPDALHLPGRVAQRRPPQELIREVDPHVGVSGHRPGWIAAAYYPRPLPGLGRPAQMRRINGRPVGPLYVFGPDDRQTYWDSSWPWGLMGKVFNSDGWVGSGALIGPRLVATASHMVPWDSSPWWMRFVPAYYNGVSLHGASVESDVSDAEGYEFDGIVANDWAVLRLYEPLGEWLGYFGYNRFSSSWEDDSNWTVLGYPLGVASGERPSYQTGVSVFDIELSIAGVAAGGIELETKADVTPGNSGGPMFGWWSGDPRLVGVVSAQEEEWSPGAWPWEWADVEKSNIVAGGPGFTSLMAWGRTNWP